MDKLGFKKIMVVHFEKVLYHSNFSCLVCFCFEGFVWASSGRIEFDYVDRKNSDSFIFRSHYNLDNQRLASTIIGYLLDVEKL